MLHAYLRFYLFSSFIFLGISTSAQVIDNTSTFKTVHRKSYFRLFFDNDYFTKTDYYYTQGITLEYVHPILKNGLPAILSKARSERRSGIATDLFAYTPTSILSDSILETDRPFASLCDIRIFSIETDTIKKHRLSSVVSIGMMGPVTKGYEIQNDIHKWTKNPRPHGWQYQLRNDLLVNYRLNYETQLAAASDNFLLNGLGELRVGTLNNSISAGFNFMVGNFNDPYRTADKKRVECYLYVQLKGNIIAYDATLQGGFFSKENPYTLPAANIENFTFQSDAGIVVNFRKFYLCYSQAVLSKEFRSGKFHRWGGISIGFSL